MERFKKNLDYYLRKHDIEKCYSVCSISNTITVVSLGIIYDIDDKLVVKFYNDRCNFTAKKIMYDDNSEPYVNYAGMDLYLSEFIKMN